MVIGVVGKSGSGKNQIADYLGRVYQHTVLDLDIYGHKFIDTNSESISNMFGKSIMVGGFVDRSILADLVFSDKNKLAKLEEMSHAWIEKEVRSIVDFNQLPNVIINAALLHKSSLLDECDFVIYVKAPLMTRIKRLIARDNRSFFSIVKRLFSQRNINRKMYKHKDCHVVMNDGMLSDLYSNLEIYKHLLSKDIKVKA